MMAYQSRFFYPYVSTEVHKNMLSESDPSFERLKFLILIMQILYLFNIQWVAASLGSHQSELIKELYVICGGMMIFVTITIKFLWVMKNKTSLENSIHTECH
jgi:hypothetical protein